MFTHTRSIFLKETDATGVIYFTSLLHYALEAFEVLLHKNESGLSQIFAKGYLMPIVHAEADYFSPLRVGDEIEIRIMLGKLGTSSITFQYEFLAKQNVVGRVEVVHVSISKQTGEKIPIPPQLKQIFAVGF